MVTTKLSYSHTIGIASFEGRGFMNPIDANHNQSFENASILILFAKHKSTTGIAPRKILKNAIVIGPKE